MVLAMAFRATFLLSGMLGMRFGFGGGGDKSKIFEAKVPFNITMENQTLVQLSSGLLENTTAKYSAAQETTTTTTTTVKATIRGTRKVRTFQLPGYDTNSTYDFALNGKCGPGRCNGEQMCVTWIKQKQQRYSQESPVMGEYHKKINPSGGELCGNEEIHSIIYEPQTCLNDNPPCPLVWKYKCIKRSEALDEDLQSCRYKSCPSDKSCVEVAECGEDPPCISRAVCK